MKNVVLLGLLEREDDENTYKLTAEKMI